MSKTKELTVRDQRYQLADSWLKTHRKGQKLAAAWKAAQKVLGELTDEVTEITKIGTDLEAKLKQCIFTADVTVPIKCIILSDAEVLLIPVEGQCMLLGAI